MKTNFEKLSVLEITSIIVAVVGMTLIGCEVYMSLPGYQQAQVSNAFEILDIHEQFVPIVNSAQLTIGTVQDFYNEFDIAFTQTFSYPDAIGTPVLAFVDSYANYTESLALDYQNSTTRFEPWTGHILGAQRTESSAMPHHKQMIYNQK